MASIDDEYVTSSASSVKVFRHDHIKGPLAARNGATVGVSGRSSSLAVRTTDCAVAAAELWAVYLIAEDRVSVDKCLCVA